MSGTATSATLQCELSWKVEERPPGGGGAGETDIAAVEYVADTQVVSVVRFIEDRDGGVRVFFDYEDKNGTLTLDASSHPLGQWARASLLIQRGRVMIVRDGVELVTVSGDVPLYDSLRLFVGAYGVQSTPWRVRFDDIVCERQ